MNRSPTDHDADTIVYRRNEAYVTPEGLERPNRIVAASILHKDRIWTGKCHADLVSQIREDTGEEPYDDEKGFLTNTGHHCMRTAAMAIVRRYKQIPDSKETLHEDMLHSEDLWK